MEDNTKVAMLDMLVFKSPSRVDWDKTLDNMTEWIKTMLPGLQPSAAAMMAVDLEKQLRYKVKKAGVRFLYKKKEALGC